MTQNKVDNMDFFEQTGYVFSLINKTWEAFKVNWPTFVLLYVLPTALLLLWIPIAMAPFLVDQSTGTAVTGVLSFIFTLLIIFVLLLVVPATALTQIASVQGRKLNINEALNQSKGFVLRFLGAAIVISLIALAPLMLALVTLILLIGFVILPFAIAWAVVVYAVSMLVPFVLVTQNKDIKSTLQESYALTKTNWRWILAVIIVLFVINLISAVWVIGWIVAFVLGVLYFCLPAYVFVNHIQVSKANSFSADVIDVKPKKVTTKKKSGTKKK